MMIKKQITSLCVFTALFSFAKAQNRDSLIAESYKHLKTKNEEKWQEAANNFYRLNMKNVSDSILKAEKVKFPEGMITRQEQAQFIYDEKDPVKKEAMYYKWIKRFPPAKFGTDRITYDYVRNAVGGAYANADSVAKAVKFANMVETSAWKGEGWAGIGNILAKKGHTKEAEALLKKAVDTSYAFKTAKVQDNAAKFAGVGYRSYNSILARLLYNDKEYTEALKYADNAYKAYQEEGSVNGAMLDIYAKSLIALGRDQEAFDKIDEAVRAGQATPDMKVELKTLYAKVKGNDGYDAYIAEVNKQLTAKITKELSKQMINTPAPDFTLTDLNGKQVTLSELKGKIVVVDFWATWCGPCKASFPVMKQAVQRYEQDKDVQFLFIHTWEKDDKAVADTKKFIADNDYPFEVLMDLKDAAGVNKAVTAFKVSGIPTKFVVDKEGNIRFKFTGFSGGADAALEEISAMINLVKG